MKDAIQSIAVVGTGNVAFHLCSLFKKAGVNISYLVARNIFEGERFCELFGCRLLLDINELPKNEIALLCIADDDIALLVSQIDPEICVAYTSGSVALQSVEPRKSIGVFYPLQTFSKSREGHMEEFPIFIEASDDEFRTQLTHLAKNISSNVQYADSEKRRKLHLAAVWVNNFTNHIIYHAQEIAEINGVAFDDLLPLLKETIAKLDWLSAFEAQTGPARRGDLNVISAQSKNFKGLQKEIYDILSKSIIETYNK